MTKITGEYITLQQLLKKEDVISSGGEVKFFLEENEVKVNGEVCRMRGKKLRPGDVIQVGKKSFTIE